MPHRCRDAPARAGRATIVTHLGWPAGVVDRTPRQVHTRRVVGVGPPVPGRHPALEVHMTGIAKSRFKHSSDVRPFADGIGQMHMIDLDGMARGKGRVRARLALDRPRQADRRDVELPGRPCRPRPDERPHDHPDGRRQGAGSTPATSWSSVPGTTPGWSATRPASSWTGRQRSPTPRPWQHPVARPPDLSHRRGGPWSAVGEPGAQEMVPKMEPPIGIEPMTYASRGRRRRASRLRTSTRSPRSEHKRAVACRPVIVARGRDGDERHITAGTPPPDARRSRPGHVQHLQDLDRAVLAMRMCSRGAVS